MPISAIAGRAAEAGPSSVELLVLAVAFATDGLLCAALFSRGSMLKVVPCLFWRFKGLCVSL